MAVAATSNSVKLMPFSHFSTIFVTKFGGNVATLNDNTSKILKNAW